jgi:hypothetical protein
MRPARPDCFPVGSSNLPPFFVCEVWRFFYIQKSSGFALVSQPKPSREFYSRDKMKDQSNKNPFAGCCARTYICVKVKTKRPHQNPENMRFYSLLLITVLAAFTGRAHTIIEKFTANPALDGWRIYGDTNLFQWNSTNQNLDVTWDSSQTNSYFYLPLGQTLTTNDSFCIQFDLNLTDVDAVGYYQLAVGLCNFADSTSSTFSRANGISPNLFEFDYYPDGPQSFGPSIDATLVDTNSNFYFAYDATQPLINGTTYHIILLHQANASTVSGEVLANGEVVSTLPAIYAGGAGAFQLDTLAIDNYTTLDDVYGDSLLAHGTVDNLVFASPLPVGTISTVAAGQVKFASDTNWLYTVQQTADFQTWSTAAPAVPGNGTNLVIQAISLPTDKSFYRVRADVP